MPILHQLVAGFRHGDAVSDEACLIRDLCASHGLASDIRCPRAFVRAEDLSLVRDAEMLPGEVRADDIALLHLSSGSLSNRIFANLPCRRILLYHNITPPRYFERLAPATARILEEGLQQAAELRDATDEAWADSSFNASELRAMGYRNPKVLPLLLKDSFGRGEIAEWRRDMLSDPPLTNLLFVGRLVPNKRLDRLIAVFGNYQRYVNPASRLVVVGAIGGAGGSEAYRALLLGSAFVYAARNVLFTDYVDDANLRACYASASAYVCMSDHEGFCAPLLEAMAWHVPVFAWDAGAVPETLDGAGVLFARGTPGEVMAETIGRVLGDSALRTAVIRRQDERLARYRARDQWAELRTMLGLADESGSSPS